MKSTLIFGAFLCICQLNGQGSIRYSAGISGNAMFLRYDPRQNSVMSNYVQSIKEWNLLLNGEVIDVEEIYRRLEPSFATFQPALFGEVYLDFTHIKLALGASTGRYNFRTFSWNIDALFKQRIDEWWSVEAGYTLIHDESFGADAAINSASNTPENIKKQMRTFIKENMFGSNNMNGLKAFAYRKIDTKFEAGIGAFVDFTRRPDNSRSDFLSILLRTNLN